MAWGSELRDLMMVAEQDWRQRLAPVNLVVEADFTADEVRIAQGHYGDIANEMLRAGHRHFDIIKRYPAITLITLVGHAALAYDQQLERDNRCEPPQAQTTSAGGPFDSGGRPPPKKSAVGDRRPDP